jgi:hypothetical protein
LLALFALFAVASSQTQADCTQFCDLYNVTCMGLAPANDIYATMQACMNECMMFPMDLSCPTGDVLDPTNCGSGNSYGCRRYHLNVANQSTANAPIHCPHSTPLSSPTADITTPDALTGTYCNTTVMGQMQNGLLSDFCNQVVNPGVCGSYLNGLTESTCVEFYAHLMGTTDVSNYADGTGSTPPRQFPLAAITGNTLACRRYHVQAARDTMDTATHCPHALMGGTTNPCSTDCEFYCAMGMQICPSEFNSATCMSDCAAKVPVAMNYTITTNKDVVCRIYHLSVASQSAANANMHCPHTSIMSTPDTCGTGGAAGLSFSALLIAALALVTKFAS